MATLSNVTSAICTTGLRWEVPKVAAAASSFNGRRLPAVTTALQVRNAGSSKVKKADDRRSLRRRVSVHTSEPQSHRQFVARAAADDEPSESSQHNQTEQVEVEQHEGQTEPLQIGEENSLPQSPAGGLQFDEPDPRKQLEEAEQKEQDGIIVEDAHLSPLPADSNVDLPQKQMTGWSESACDEGSVLFDSNSVSVNMKEMSSSYGSSDSLLIDRLLESLPVYDQGRSAEHYRIRAAVYGRIAEYFSKADKKSRSYEVKDKKEENRLDVKLLTAMQQLADFILAEEGQTSADYNCRAKFFENSAEIFCKVGENSTDGSKEEVEKELQVERLVSNLQDAVLSGNGRSASDYSRRAKVFGTTADFVSHGKKPATIK
ncbi:hypothetical protein R1sor_015850 [Riccia sorocarpa]|uniref:Uncharacterized protein n=1 Tax=Riccia sorocarpa TaxID=122646 RepID=A0ABD3HFB4_9MARC